MNVTETEITYCDLPAEYRDVIDYVADLGCDTGKYGTRCRKCVTCTAEGIKGRADLQCSKSLLERGLSEVNNNSDKFSLIIEWKAEGCSGEEIKSRLEAEGFFATLAPYGRLEQMGYDAAIVDYRAYDFGTIEPTRIEDEFRDLCCKVRIWLMGDGKAFVARLD